MKPYTIALASSMLTLVSSGAFAAGGSVAYSAADPMLRGGVAPAPFVTPSPFDAGSGSSSFSRVISKLAVQIDDLTGTEAKTACAGFRSVGDCLAAAHVSRNLGLSFDTLRSKVTGRGKQDLVKAIQQLQPAADAKAEALKAHEQARHDVKIAQA
jgi:hypothetical protein